MINGDDILMDVEMSWIKQGEVYLFSDCYLALKYYDRKKSNLENNKVNKKYGYVYKGELHGKLKRGEHPFVCKTEHGELVNTTFICRI